MKSIPFDRLLDAVRQVFDIAVASGHRLPVRVMPLSDIEQAWQEPGSPRVVISLPSPARPGDWRS